MASSIFQPINPPYAQDVEGAGLFGFLSNLIQIIAIAAGIFAFINLVLAGFGYITSNGEPDKLEAAWKKIYLSLIGLVIIVSAYVLIGIVSWIFFGNPSFILSPTITGPK